MGAIIIDDVGSGERTRSNGVISFLRSLSRKEVLTVASILWLDFLNFATLSVLAPFFPGEAAMKGMSPSVTGLVFGCFAMVNFVACPIFGKITPHLGLKRVMMSGLALSGVCNILFGLLDKLDNLTLFTLFCFLVRIMEALGAAAFLTSTITLMATMFPKNMGTIMGVTEMSIGLGLSIGPGIGGFLYAWGGYPAPFVTLGTIILINIPCLACLIHACDATHPRSGSIFSFFKHPPTVVIAFMTMFGSLIWTYLQPTLAIHLQQFDLSPQILGLFFVWAAGIYAISCPIVGAIGDAMNRTWPLMAVGLALSSVGFLLIGPSSFLDFLPKTIWLNLVSLAIIAVTCAMVLVPTYQSFIDYAKDGGMEDSIGTYSVIGGVWSSMFYLGDTIGPSTSGILVDHYGFEMSTTIAGVFNFFMSVVVATFFACWHHWRSCWCLVRSRPGESTPLVASGRTKTDSSGASAQTDRHL